MKSYETLLPTSKSCAESPGPPIHDRTAVRMHSMSNSSPHNHAYVKFMAVSSLPPTTSYHHDHSINRNIKSSSYQRFLLLARGRIANVSHGLQFLHCHSALLLQIPFINYLEKSYVKLKSRFRFYVTMFEQVSESNRLGYS
jgi:hypothetical protein